MQMIFHNADNFQVPRALFVAAWKVWFKRFGPDVDAWREGRMPIISSQKPLHELLADGYGFSLEVLSRLMVPWSFRDTQQATDEFIRLNPAVVRHADYEEENGASISGARLTDQALDYWDSLTFNEQDLHLNFAEARIQADIESPSDHPCILDDFGLEIIGEDIYPLSIPSSNEPDEAFIRALVAWINEAPHQPMYQRKAVGEAVSGWHDRLLAFFWPKPRTGYLEYSFSTCPLLYRAELLADSLLAGESWDHEMKMLAEKTANEIFMIAGVPQREVTWQNVRNLIDSAINGSANHNANSSAKMNSGWAVMASMATVNLKEKTGRPALITWNSRVSSAVLSRLDFLLVEAGCTELGGRFANIGTIPGWGGTRPREFSLKWPSAYRSWESMYAAAELVDIMVDELNSRDESGTRRYTAMPLPGGDQGDWTPRGVQLVLFSDGY